jgi:hypothetical protein
MAPGPRFELGLRGSKGQRAASYPIPDRRSQWAYAASLTA